MEFFERSTFSLQKILTKHLSKVSRIPPSCWSIIISSACVFRETGKLIAPAVQKCSEVTSCNESCTFADSLLRLMANIWKSPAKKWICKLPRRKYDWKVQNNKPVVCLFWERKGFWFLGPAGGSRRGVFKVPHKNDMSVLFAFLFYMQYTHFAP